MKLFWWKAIFPKNFDLENKWKNEFMAKKDKNEADSKKGPTQNRFQSVWTHDSIPTALELITVEFQSSAKNIFKPELIFSSTYFSFALL